MPITDIVQTTGIVGAVLILLVWVVSTTPTPWKKRNNNPGGLSELAREIVELRETLSRKLDSVLNNQTEELRLLERMDGKLSGHSAGDNDGDGGGSNSN